MYSRNGIKVKTNILIFKKWKQKDLSSKTSYEEIISEIKSKTNTDISSLVLSEVNDDVIPASGEAQIDIATASCIHLL